MNIKGGPVDRITAQDPFSSKYRYDNESSTDEEMSEGEEEESSSDDDDFKSKIGEIATKTSHQGKVRISSSSKKEEQEEEKEELDDFEKEMEREMDQRMLQAEKDASIANTELHTAMELEQERVEMEMGEEEEEQQLAGSSSAADKKDKDKKDCYDDIYFDSDEEDNGGEGKKDKAGADKRKYKTDDELLYDPKMDDEDQSWVDDVRRSYQNPLQQQNSASKDNPKPLANSDAVLNCPACFAVVCLDCQRHSTYKTQYRAMFVINCSVITDEIMRIPIKKKGKGKKGKGKEVTHPDDEYHPVRCDQCRTEIAMYDKDEVYHFFNVVASHT